MKRIMTLIAFSVVLMSVRAEEQEIDFEALLDQLAQEESQVVTEEKVTTQNVEVAKADVDASGVKTEELAMSHGMLTREEEPKVEETMEVTIKEELNPTPTTSQSITKLKLEEEEKDKEPETQKTSDANAAIVQTQGINQIETPLAKSTTTEFIDDFEDLED